MNIKNLTLAVAVALAVAGCASNKPLTKNAELKPNSDSIQPKPVSTVFHRPQGTMTITFSNDGKFLEIVSKGTAPIAGNNAFSIEQAAQVAELRAKRNISEFLNTTINTTRTSKVLSTAVQRSLENTANGMEDEVKIDDKDFDTNGDPVISAYHEDRMPVAKEDRVNPNTNSEKVAEVVRENISTASASILRGVVISDEHIDQRGRSIVVEVRSSVNTINASNDLRKLMGNN